MNLVLKVLFTARLRLLTTGGVFDKVAIGVLLQEGCTVLVTQLRGVVQVPVRVLKVPGTHYVLSACWIGSQRGIACACTEGTAGIHIVDRHFEFTGGITRCCAIEYGIYRYGSACDGGRRGIEYSEAIRMSAAITEYAVVARGRVTESVACSGTGIDLAQYFAGAASDA